ncbi:MAG: NPCBM/NEW2 domain-containing protein [Planctomycetes bacterium]|nr:NPCBM/NEW2 domain-containing protein [Planctomycetota bacterium]
MNGRAETTEDCRAVPVRLLAPRAIAMCLFALVATSAVAEEPRFIAMFAGGAREAANEVHDWHDSKSQPRIGSRALFDPNQPVRWLIDRSLPMPETPTAYVEFVGGDRFPGDALEFRSGTADPYERRAPHLVVQPAVDVRRPGTNDELPVRLLTRWVRRVVWKPLAGDDYRPGTVFFDDGSRISFRSLRWMPTGVTLLVDDGIREIGFGAMAQLHLPSVDPWEAYFEQLAVLTPTCEARLMQSETTDGTRVTTSAERFEPMHHGDQRRPESWHHVVQPAWSLDPFWLRFPTVRTRRFFHPHEPPLTLAAPSRVEQQSIFGGGWRLQADQSVHGRPLASGEHEFAWGYGVQAASELEFPLPECARTFRTQLGLDRTSGDGGSVRATVALAGAAPRPLFDSGLLVGSASIADTGSLALGEGAGRKLVLAVDSLATSPPPGADPFDIRDALDWFEPQLGLDPAVLKAEVARRIFTATPVLEGWQLAAVDPATVTAVNHWDASDANDPRFRLLLGTTGPFVAMSQRMKIEAGDRWLALAASRMSDEYAPSRLQVKLDGRALAEVMLTGKAASPESFEPLLIPLDDERERTALVEIVQIPQDKTSLVDWRAVLPLAHRPGLLRVFEDDEGLVAALTGGEGTVETVVEGAHSGRAFLRVTSPGRWEALLQPLKRLPGGGAVIRERPRLGEYRYIRFAWRKPDKGLIGLGVGHDGELGGDENDARAFFAQERGRPKERKRSRRNVEFDGRGYRHGFRYDAGAGDPERAPVLRLDRNLPSKWSLITRDLYGDFGNFTLTGLELTAAGGAADFDHIYLARAPHDFNHIPEQLPPPETPTTPPADPNIAKSATDPLRYGEVLSVAAPQFTTEQSGGGLQLLKQYAPVADVPAARRDNVVRTMPPDQGKPCVLRAAVTIPAGKKAALHATVSHQETGDWQLIVMVEGQKLHDSIIGAATVKDGWANLAVDLSQFAGKCVLVEVHNHPNNWPNEAAYWKRLQILHQE